MNPRLEILDLASRVNRIERSTAVSTPATPVTDSVPVSKNQSLPVSAHVPFTLTSMPSDYSYSDGDHPIRLRSGRVIAPGGNVYEEKVDALPTGTTKSGSFYTLSFGSGGITSDTFVWVLINFSDESWKLTTTTSLNQTLAPWYNDTNLLAIPICFISWDASSSTFRPWAFRRLHSGDIYLSGTGGDCPRWKVSVDSDGYIRVSPGTWMVKGVCYEWVTDGEGKPEKAAGITGTADTTAPSVHISSLGAVNYVVAYWTPDGSATYGLPEPVLDQAGWTLAVGVASSEFSSAIGLTCNRNIRRLATINVADTDGVYSITQHHCEDIESDDTGISDDAVAWSGTTYSNTWAGNTGAVPNRPLIDYYNEGFMDDGIMQLQNEHLQANYSSNIFISDATNTYQGDISQGPDATGSWAMIDDTIGATGSTKVQSTLEVRRDTTSTLPHNVYYIGLTNVWDIDATYVGSWSCYFKAAAKDSAGEAKGALAWAPYDSTHDIPLPYKSIDVQDGKYISVWGFRTSDEWTVPMSDNLNPAKELKWKHPVIWNDKGGGVVLDAGDPGGDDLWHDVVCDMTQVGNTITFNTRSVTWADGVSNFGPPATGSTISFDIPDPSDFVTLPEDYTGGPGACDVIDWCLGQEGHRIDHDVDLVVVTPTEGNLQTSKAHHGTYWANESNPTADPDANDYVTTGEVTVGNLVVTEETAAGSASGAVNCAGGGYFGNGIYADKGGAAAAGYFDNTFSRVALCDASWAILTSGTGGGTGDVNVTGGSYFHEHNPGATLSGYLGGGIVLGAPVALSLGDIDPVNDKILVWRPA